MDDQRLTRIEQRLDSIDDNLAEHMKRSDALEAVVKPVHEALIEFKGAIKLIKYVGGFVTFIVLLAEFLHWRL